jgi:hypothetical protein
MLVVPPSCSYPTQVLTPRHDHFVLGDHRRATYDLKGRPFWVNAVSASPPGSVALTAPYILTSTQTLGVTYSRALAVSNGTATLTVR